ncbi:hypothetical protein L3Q82_017006 [Scortum barcoo]|uniref:Uncharacterized protein n=1 Tax=Scortum barcoo TaxID=214431 RepID=A0ACB8XCJ5_9TELE|nr:hypothetical protein L3Q82_017006 [Scortum barcoo]
METRLNFLQTRSGIGEETESWLLGLLPLCLGACRPGAAEPARGAALSACQPMSASPLPLAPSPLRPPRSPALIQLVSKKVFSLYSLVVRQLSKQDHYDFDLRALTSLLHYAGKKLCSFLSAPDEETPPNNTVAIEESRMKERLCQQPGNTCCDSWMTLTYRHLTTLAPSRSWSTASGVNTLNRPSETPETILETSRKSADPSASGCESTAKDSQAEAAEVLTKCHTPQNRSQEE